MRIYCADMKYLTDQDIIQQQQREIAQLKLEVEELECKLQGLIKCIECDGTGRKLEGCAGRLGHPEDPLTRINCPTCDGDGWVKA